MRSGQSEHLAGLPGDASARDPLRSLDEFLASLVKTDRALLLLYLEDLSYREMADILGISESHLLRIFVPSYLLFVRAKQVVVPARRAVCQPERLS